MCWRLSSHDDLIKWKHFPLYWPFVRRTHPSAVNSPHKGQWRRALMFSLICTLNKRLCKQSWDWWFDTPLRSLWRHCNELCTLLVRPASVEIVHRQSFIFLCNPAMLPKAFLQSVFPAIIGESLFNEFVGKQFYSLFEIICSVAHLGIFNYLWCIYTVYDHVVYSQINLDSWPSRWKWFPSTSTSISRKLH